MTRAAPGPAPAPLALHKRRWTARLMVAFAVFMAGSGLYATLIVLQLPGRVGLALAGLFAFTSFCFAGALGKAGWDALTVPGPWLVIDAQGLTDTQGKLGTVPWHHMRKVELDDYEHRIVVTLHPDSGSPHARGRLVGTLLRLQNGGDVVFPLGGLVYDARQLSATLQAFHSRGQH